MPHTSYQSFSSDSSTADEAKLIDEHHEEAVPEQPDKYPAQQRFYVANRGCEAQPPPQGAIRSLAATLQQHDLSALPLRRQSPAPVQRHAAGFSNNANSPPPKRAFTSLRFEQTLAILAGSLSLTLGALGLGAFFFRGPLSSLFIPAANFSGSLVNASSVGSVVAGIATAMSAVGQQVLAGVSRAYLRRKAVRGEGVAIKRWRVLSSGISLYKLRKAPWLACGVFLAFMVAMAMQSSAFAGVAIPVSRSSVITSSYGPVIPYLNNGGIGPLINCVNLFVDQLCITYSIIPTIANAFFQAISNSTGIFSLEGALISSSSGFMAGMEVLAAPLASADKPPPIFQSGIAISPVSIFNSTCLQLTSAGITAGQYSYFSPCSNSTALYGDATISNGNYIDGQICPSESDRVTYYVEIGVGGAIYGRANDDYTFAVRCAVRGWEGIGNTTYLHGVVNTISATYDTFSPLSQLDMITMGTGFIAAIKSEAGLEGNPGVMGVSMSSAIATDGSGFIDTDLIAERLSNAFAAAAAAGYILMVGGGPKYSNGTLKWPFDNVISDLDVYWVLAGYGWTRSARILAWSIMCCLIGMAWFSAAVYMVGGGTRYDPTDWYQTLNTAAGSDLHQRQGTCTSGNIHAQDVDNNEIWYGEIGPKHVGFGQVRIGLIDPKQKYGCASSGVSTDENEYAV